MAEFYARVTGPKRGKPNAYCKPCVKADNIARARARGVLPKADADPLARLRLKLRQYHLTVEQYHDMLEMQGRRCPGCGVSCDEPGITRFSVDHDHACCPGTRSCGECVRGLLCNPCNLAIGHVADNPHTLIALGTYLAAYGTSHLCVP